MVHPTTIPSPKQPASHRRTTPTNLFQPAQECPVCRNAGCLVASEQGTIAAVCCNTESIKPIGTLGWLHLVEDRGPVWSRSRQAVLKAARRLAEVGR